MSLCYPAITYQFYINRLPTVLKSTSSRPWEYTAAKTRDCLRTLFSPHKNVIFLLPLHHDDVIHLNDFSTGFFNQLEI